MVRLHRIGDALGVRVGPAAGLLAMLVATDLVLIGLHLSRRIFGRPSHVHFGLGADTGYGEMLFAFQMFWLMLALLWIAIRLRAAVLLAWAAATGFLLLDDLLQLHENAGRLFGIRFADELGYLGSHLGELLWFGAIGLALGGVLLVLHLRARQDARRVSAVLFVLFACLVLFGVVIDLVQGIFVRFEAANAAFTVIEDGGELLVLSVVVAFAFAVAFCGHSPSLSPRLAALLRVRQQSPPQDSPADPRTPMQDGADLHSPGDHARLRAT